MILQALQRLALQEHLVGDPDFEIKPVSWRVNLRADGSLVGIEDLRQEVSHGKRTKRVGKDVQVPMQFYRSGSVPPPFFLVDNAKFVFGKKTGNTEFEPQQGREFSERFRRLVGLCAEETEDPDALAVVQFLKQYPPGSTEISLPEEAVGNDLFAFRVGTGEFVHLRPAVQQWWKRQRQSSLQPGSKYQCLVTGKYFGEIQQFPQVSNVPGAPKPIKLISFNQNAFESYGLKRNENAAVSREAGEQVAAALNRLLQPQPHDGSGKPLKKRHLRLPGDTAVCFWSAQPSQATSSFLDELPDLLEGEDEAAVSNVYRSVWHGTPVDLHSPEAFFVLTLSGAQGRAIVRDWLESSLESVIRHLAEHFRDLQVVRAAKPRKGSSPSPTVPLRWLMNSLAAEGKSEPPGSLESAFVRAAFLGLPYPFQLLQHALVRSRVETGRGEWSDTARQDARASLLKAVLNRRRRFDSQAASRYQEVSPDMNANHSSPGYNLGLLMASLERLQSLALGNVNASIVDRYFSAASSTPRVVFVRLLKNAQHHARKGRDKDDRRERALVLRCERIIDQIADRFDVEPGRGTAKSNGLPSHLDLEQQALFVLGYHQMRHWLWMTNDERGTWESEHPDAPAAFRWLKQPVDTESLVV